VGGDVLVEFHTERKSRTVLLKSAIAKTGFVDVKIPGFFTIKLTGMVPMTHEELWDVKVYAILTIKLPVERRPLKNSRSILFSSSIQKRPRRRRQRMNYIKKCYCVLILN